MRRLIGILACASLPALAQQGGPAVEVIGTTPLPGVGVPRDAIPANVQTGTAAELRNPGVLTLPDFMERGLDSVTVNAAQGNPFQPDVNFRGFTASPLLGTQPGLSVFQDGVRVNEPFGDSVNWDLIPKSAISSMALIPGSNPVFGLNTLGGALVVTTKSGFDSPGLSTEAYGGSFGRRAGEIEYGGGGDRVAYFVTGNLFDESGWRDYSASPVRRHEPRPLVHRREQRAQRCAERARVVSRGAPLDRLHLSGHLQERPFVREPRRQALLLRPERARGQRLQPQPEEQNLQHQRQRRFRSGAAGRAR
jgi:hypothetical protein